jgi:hypothetical protein
MYDTTPPYLRPACMCEFINTGMADGRVPTFRCPAHPGHKALPAPLLDRTDYQLLRIFQWHREHPIAVYFWGVLTGLLFWLKFR